MNMNFSNPALTSFAFGCLLFSSSSAMAQVVGATTTAGVSVIEATQLAMGWSVKRTLMSR
jgi:hypothetical protein